MPLAPTASIPTKKAEWDLFLISFIILFFELTCILWLGSTVIFLTFFTNIVLLACFLGIIFALAFQDSQRPDIPWGRTPPGSSWRG
jgi:hypothetical protein